MMSIALLTSVMLLATGSVNAQTLVVSQQTAAPKATSVESAASREVSAAAAAIVDAFGRHEPKKYFSHFAPDATFVFHTTLKRLNTRASTKPSGQLGRRKMGSASGPASLRISAYKSLATSQCSPIQSRLSYPPSRDQARCRSVRPSSSIDVAASG